MFNESSKVESATVVFCVFQLVFLFVSGLSYYGLSYRVRHFDYGKLAIHEERILESVQKATIQFLQDYQTNLENDVSSRIHEPSTDIVKSPGCVYNTLRTEGAIIDGVDYRRGDYIKVGTNLWLVAILDVDGQRVYCANDFGDRLIVQMTATLNDDDSVQRRPAQDDTRERGLYAPARGDLGGSVWREAL